ncbi:Rap1a/Tai family immunity protein [Kiloniella antarctica]|uniref:Rap1a/Tai family immunity protein n=1 Tax=Kiloniella antarctica TaxID=1550907 RepID=A0ABW5BD72_9PROT
MPKYFLIISLFFFMTNAQAETQLQKKQLDELCSSEDRWYGGLCNGYITGTVESLLEMREQGLIAEAFCFPPDTDRGKYIETVRTQLPKNAIPTSAFESIVLILRDKYPCE